MTSLNVKPGLLPSSIVLPRSKSHANRALILAAVSPGVSILSHVPRSTDVQYLIQALRQVGLKIDGEDILTISGNFPDCEPKGGAIVDVGEGGTTGRFLACLLTLGKETYQLKLGKRLQERPWDEFISLISEYGGTATLNGSTLIVRGPISWPKLLEVDCSRTTQFASGFQLALSQMSCEVRPVKMKSSQSYWELTRLMIEEFKRHREYTIPMDWSSASYPLAFGALKQNIRFPGLTYDSSQADSKFFDVLKSLDAIDSSTSLLTVKPLIKVRDISLDVSDCLDLVPALAFFLSHVPGKHLLQNVDNLKVKESDRLQEVQSILKKFKKNCALEGDTLIIFGDGSTQSELINLVLPDDHRIVMTGALFLRLHGGGSIEPAEAVAKSYPNFFDLINF